MTKKDCFLHGRTTVGERGQIVIPRSIRETLKIRAGDEMVVMARGDKIIVFPASKLESWFEALMGQVESIRKTMPKTRRPSPPSA